VSREEYGTRALGWERPGRQSAQASNSVQEPDIWMVTKLMAEEDH